MDISRQKSRLLDTTLLKISCTAVNSHLDILTSSFFYISYSEVHTSSNESEISELENVNIQNLYLLNPSCLDKKNKLEATFLF